MKTGLKPVLSAEGNLSDRLQEHSGSNPVLDRSNKPEEKAEELNGGPSGNGTSKPKLPENSQSLDADRHHEYPSARKSPVPEGTGKLPPLSCRYHEDERSRNSILAKFLRVTRVDTCFCFGHNIKGPKPGSKPKIMKLRTPQSNAIYEDDVDVRKPNNRPDNKVCRSKLQYSHFNC